MHLLCKVSSSTFLAFQHHKTKLLHVESCFTFKTIRANYFIWRFYFHFLHNYTCTSIKLSSFNSPWFFVGFFSIAATFGNIISSNVLSVTLVTLFATLAFVTSHPAKVSLSSWTNVLSKTELWHAHVAMWVPHCGRCKITLFKLILNEQFRTKIYYESISV